MAKPKKGPSFRFSLILTGALGIIAGAVIGGISAIILQAAGVVVAPILVIGWGIGVATGSISMKFGFSNIIERGNLGTSIFFWGAGCATVGAVIGGIIGTFLLPPGLGTLFGSLIGAGIGAGFAVVSGFFIRMCVWNCEEAPEIWKDVTVDELDSIDTSRQLQGLGPSRGKKQAYSPTYTPSTGYQRSFLGSVLPLPPDSISQTQGHKTVTPNSW